MTTTSERLFFESPQNGIEARINRLGLSSHANPSEHPMIRAYKHHEVAPADIHDDLVDEYGDPYAEPNFEEAEEEIEPLELKSKIARKIVKLAVKLESHAVKREELGPMHRRIGRSALSAAQSSSSYVGDKLRYGIDLIGIDPDDPESVAKDGLLVKKIASYRSDEAKQERAERRKEAKNHKILDTSQNKLEKANVKYQKNVEKAEYKAEKIKIRHSKRLDKVEVRKNRKQEKLDLNRGQRVRGFMGRLALGFNTLALNYTSRFSYGHYGRTHRMGYGRQTVADLTAESDS